MRSPACAATVSFPIDYKCVGLTLVELVVPDGQGVSLPNLAGSPDGYPAEWAAYYRTEHDARCGELKLGREGVLVGSESTVLTARGGPTYVALAGSGPQTDLMARGHQLWKPTTRTRGPSADTNRSSVPRGQKSLGR